MALRRNPDFHMPPQKEIRYWNEGNLIPEHSIFRALLSRHWHYRHVRKELMKHLAKAMLGRVPAGEAAWYCRYLFGRRSDSWYCSLFDGREEVLTGDISPLYYHLEEEDVARIARYNPYLKIVILVRDPVARVWSKVRMNLLRHMGREREEVPEEEFYRTFYRLRETEQLWKRYFPEVYLGFFDQLRSDPDAFYASLLEFLGAGIPEGLRMPRKKTNRGLPVSVPDAYRQLLVDQYRDEIIRIRDSRYGDYARQWIKRYGI
jgi:hypothetical protein